jgi:tRNA(adenine34) deaminase
MRGLGTARGDAGDREFVKTSFEKVDSKKPDKDFSGEAFMQNDDQWMRLAIAQALEGIQQKGGAEVGCVILKNGVVLQRAHNEVELRKDPTAHAEMVAIRGLCKELGTPDLSGCTLFCTLQPCGMCSLACIWAGISRIVYGATRASVNSVYFETRHANTSDFIRDCFRNDLEILGGVLETECSSLYAKPEEPASDKETPAHRPTE